MLWDYQNSLEILDKQPDNWGMIKGGKTGINKKIKNLKKLWHNPRFREHRIELGKKAIKNLTENYKEYKEKSRKTKEKKRIKKILDLENSNRLFFTNREILINSEDIEIKKADREKGLRFPKRMSSDLAEEIGIHLGDGCLSFNRNYFSVKTNKKERDYMTNFIFPLYKKLFNLDLKLMVLESVVGFEICSKGLFEFKNKILKIPHGNKVNKIVVPKAILESKNKEIYTSFIRGLFDTDGCVHMVKSKNNYPVITFTIKSQRLIQQVKEMLTKLGFIHYTGRYVINLNGKIMLEKWIREINSNNPKNLVKLEQASNSTRIE